MKRVVGVLLLSILFSCSNSKESNQVPETRNDTIADMKSLNYTVESSKQEYVNKESNPNTSIGLTNLIGKAFLLGAGIDGNVCEISDECDCCNADLMFITDKQFVYDDLCEGHFVKKGNYKLQGNQITLDFESQLVSYYYNEESETNPNAPEYLLKSENKPTPRETYNIGKCKEFTIIINNVKSEDIAFPVGILKERSVMPGKVKILEQIGIWKMLELK